MQRFRPVSLHQGTGCDFGHYSRMSRQSLERHAERAERLADNTVDESMRLILLAAAQDYREQAKRCDNTIMANQPTWLQSGLEHPRSTTGF
jgi:hypothetical protein